MTATLRSERAALKQARETFADSGRLPFSPVIDSMIAKSWKRSMQAGLAPNGRLPEAGRLTAQELSRATERRHDLVAHARPVMEFLHAQTLNTGCMVMLADEHGVNLYSLGDIDFMSRAEQVSLAPGVNWNERFRGTNGIGTALAEGRPLVVCGAEHFLERNDFLSCAAAPIFAPDGDMLGVLDISYTERQNHPHTFGLVRAAAQMVENRLFEVYHGRRMRVRFHPLAEGIGTFAEGVVAISEDGSILGANQMGLALLGLSSVDLGTMQVSYVFQLPFNQMLDWAKRRPGEPMLVTCHDGSRLFVRLEPGRTKQGAIECFAADPAPQSPRDALSALDIGDERIAAAVAKSRKLIGKPIEILLQGEPGVGKEHFARAFHASGPRAEGPFLTYDCAAARPDRIEAEIFGDANGQLGCWREADGGTLFLYAIERMPLHLQARLVAALRASQATHAGDKRNGASNVTLICGSQCNLKAEIDAGRFDADLYYRINGMSMLLPSLRERHDFAALVSQLLEEIAPNRSIALEPDLASAFADYSWPGNVRQLRNALRAACAVLDESETRIAWRHLPDDLANDLRWHPHASVQEEAALDLKALSDGAISRAVAQSHGNMSEAARRLGISRNTLYRRLRGGDVRPAD